MVTKQANEQLDMASSDIASKLNRFCKEYDWSNQAEGIEDFLLNYFVGESDSEGIH